MSKHPERLGIDALRVYVPWECATTRCLYATFVQQCMFMPFSFVPQFIPDQC